MIKDIENRVVEFGKDGVGNIGISIAVRESNEGKVEKRIALTDISNLNFNIGDKDWSGDLRDTTPSTFLLFHDERSIDILIKSLEKLKEMRIEADLTDAC